MDSDIVSRYELPSRYMATSAALKDETNWREILEGGASGLKRPLTHGFVGVKYTKAGILQAGIKGVCGLLFGGKWAIQKYHPQNPHRIFYPYSFSARPISSSLLVLGHGINIPVGGEFYKIVVFWVFGVVDVCHG